MEGEVKVNLQRGRLANREEIHQVLSDWKGSNHILPVPRSVGSAQQLMNGQQCGWNHKSVGRRGVRSRAQSSRTGGKRNTEIARSELRERAVISERRGSCLPGSTGRGELGVPLYVLKPGLTPLPSRRIIPVFELSWDVAALL